MRSKFLFIMFAILLAFASTATGSVAQAPATSPNGVALTYQGYLTEHNMPANGNYDFQFALFTKPTDGSQVGELLWLEEIAVEDGLFTVDLDFGRAVFNGDARYLEIGVRAGNHADVYTRLEPRHKLTPAPYALALPGVTPRDGNVGIGTDSPQSRLHVQADAASSAAIIENRTSAGAFNVLVVKATTTDNPAAQPNFIAFTDQEDKDAGTISGNGEAGITYQSRASDFAIWLPRRHTDERMEAGDIVGLFDGNIAKATQGADHLQVISTAPLLLGNTPVKEQAAFYEKVAFTGLTTAKLRGVVQAGDYIIPSGLNDGTGIALSEQTLLPEQRTQIVGRAWESSSAEEVKLVRMAVGLPEAWAASTRLRDQEARMAALERQISSLQQQQAVLMKLVMPMPFHVYLPVITR